MAAGLIQIVTHGSQDLYLVGNPQITFFKVVYRRHTNFSMESYRLDFDSTINMGEKATITLPKIGDLLHRLYLEIDIPRTELFRAARNAGDIATALANYNTAVSNFNTVKAFMKANMEAYRAARETFKAINTVTAVDMISDIDTAFGNYAANVQTNYNSLMEPPLVLQPTLEFDHRLAHLKTIADIAQPNGANITKSEFMSDLDLAYEYSTKIIKAYSDKVNELNDTYNDLNSKKMKFAWVDDLGHSMIEYCEIFIGGKGIDKHYGQWMSLWYSLSANHRSKRLFDRMIGNVSKLTTFDRTVKESYTLVVPLHFWFCRYSGLSLPLVSLEYHDVSLDVKLRKIEECCYVEADELIYLSEGDITDTDNGRYLDELGPDEGMQIGMRLLAEFVYLDTEERRRFAQSSHEYLIEQIEVNEFPGITTSDFTALLDFNHPSKLLIWTVQQDAYTTNTSGSNKCRWNNYTTNTDGTDNPVTTSSMRFNTYDRFDKMSGDYFNYLLPILAKYSGTPNDGVNIYPFCLNGLEYQPSGTASLGLIDKVVLKTKINSDMFVNGTATMTIYSQEYNILRFSHGFAGLAFTYV